MGPKKKGKGKGKGAKKLKIKSQEPEQIKKDQYLKWIAEMNAILAQVKKETDVVEMEYFSSVRKSEEKRSDLVDVVNYLEHEIEEKEEDINFFNDKINVLTQDLKVHDDYYSEIISKMNQVFKEKRQQLVERVDYVTAKINALDEFRQSREDYLNKRDTLLMAIEEQKENHVKEMYQKEKVTIMERATMRTKMESKMTQLASDFREATDIRIGMATNKIIWDNIKLGNFLTCSQEIMRNMRTGFDNMKNNEKLSRFSLELKENEKESIKRKCEKQVRKIEMLLCEHETLAERISNINQILKRNRRLRRRFKEVEKNVFTVREQIKQIYLVLNDAEEKSSSWKTHLDKLERKICELQETLYIAAKATKAAIDVQSVKRLSSDERETEEYEDKVYEDEEASNPDLESVDDSDVLDFEKEKDASYQAREKLIRTIIEILTKQLPTEEDVETLSLISDSAEFGISLSLRGSTPSLRRYKSSKISSVTTGTWTRFKEARKKLTYD